MSMRHTHQTIKDLLMDSRNSDDADYSTAVDEAVWDAVRSMYATEPTLEEDHRETTDRNPT